MKDEDVILNELESFAVCEFVCEELLNGVLCLVMSLKYSCSTDIVSFELF